MSKWKFEPTCKRPGELIFTSTGVVREPPREDNVVELIRRDLRSAVIL